MSRTLHLALKIDTKDPDAPYLLPVARALSAYASALVEEAMNGVVITGQNKLEYGVVKMRVTLEAGDYEPQER